MIWPFGRHREKAAPVIETDRDGARAARVEAEERLQTVRARTSEVRNASRKLRDIRMRNHFAEIIDGALGEKQE